MGIEIIDPKAIALREKKRTAVMNTRKLHAWVHYYPNALNFRRWVKK